MGELRIVIRQLLLEPAPVLAGVALEKFHQPAGERVASLVHQAVTAQPAQVFIDADEAESPCPWRCEFRQGRQGQCEELSGHSLEAAEGRASHADAQGPKCAAVTVLRSLLVQPAALETQVVMKSFRSGIKGVIQKSGAGGGHGA